jgi:hypothetical protein
MVSRELQAQIVKLADEIGIDRAALLAIVQVESTGVGFWEVPGYAEKVPVINFEAHRFRALTKAHYDQLAPGISKPGPDDEYGKTEWYRFSQAAQLDREAAIGATSWGLMQVMGENWSWLGYESIEDFVSQMKESEILQIEAGCRFLQRRSVQGNSLIYWANQGRMEKVAFGYNGAGYARNHYDSKLYKALSYWQPIARSL